jgi:hypothetical protein
MGMTKNSKRVSGADESPSLREQAHTETRLVRFGAKRHTFSEEDRARSAAVRREKAAERREKAQTLPEYARTQIERDPASWFQPYEQARREGDWKAVEALQDRAYGRPRPAGVSDDHMEIEAGDVVEIRRLLLEAITVERADRSEPSDEIPSES